MEYTVVSVPGSDATGQFVEGSYRTLAACLTSSVSWCCCAFFTTRPVCTSRIFSVDAKELEIGLLCPFIPVEGLIIVSDQAYHCCAVNLTTRLLELCVAMQLWGIRCRDSECSPVGTPVLRLRSTEVLEAGEPLGIAQTESLGWVKSLHELKNRRTFSIYRPLSTCDLK